MSISLSEFLRGRAELYTDLADVFVGAELAFMSRLCPRRSPVGFKQTLKECRNTLIDWSVTGTVDELRAVATGVSAKHARQIDNILSSVDPKVVFGSTPVGANVSGSTRVADFLDGDKYSVFCASIKDGLAFCKLDSALGMHISGQLSGPLGERVVALLQAWLQKHGRSLTVQVLVDKLNPQFTSLIEDLGLAHLLRKSGADERVFSAAPGPSPAAVDGPTAAVKAIDKKERVVTMGEIVSVIGDKTVAIMIAALDAKDAWAELLSAPQEAQVAAAFAQLKVQLRQAKDADADYNAPYNLLRVLCETQKFGTMPVREFVETLFAPVPSLRAAANEILARLEQSEGRRLNATLGATAALINWTELISANGLQLKERVSVQDVIRALEELGVASFNDLQHAEVADLVNCGFKKVSANKLMALAVAPQPPRTDAMAGK